MISLSVGTLATGEPLSKSEIRDLDSPTRIAGPLRTLTETLAFG